MTCEILQSSMNQYRIHKGSISRGLQSHEINISGIMGMVVADIDRMETGLDI